MSTVTFRVGSGEGREVTARHYAAAGNAGALAAATLILAHGAGAGQRHPFMVTLATAIAALGFDVVTFDFPYMAEGRKLPDRAPVLEACYAAVVKDVLARIPSARRALFIGGKSMGGRMATHLAASEGTLPIAGLVLLGYPLHPPGKPAQLRTAHLASIRRPMLVVQGSRDTFGGPEELMPFFGNLDPPATIHVVDGGDHSFKVARAGRDGQATIERGICETVANWMTAFRIRN